MENKIIALILALLLAVTLCSCGTKKANDTFKIIPQKVSSESDDPANGTYKFKGNQKGRTVIYTMTHEGSGSNVYQIPDKIFAPFLANNREGQANEAVLSVLNYQYTTPEWSAYYFHSALFAFSDAVLKGKINTFQIKRKKGNPFFSGKVSLGKNGMPKKVKLNFKVPANKSKHETGGKDTAEYSFQYNKKNNITHVKFLEESEWNDAGSADISINYAKDGNIIRQISKLEKNPNGQFQYSFSMNYKNGKPSVVEVTKDTTDSSHLNSQKPSIPIMNYTFAENHYDGFGGERQSIAKNSRNETLMNPDGKARYKNVNTATEYIYEGTRIISLTVKDNSEDYRTYEYIDA